jgi:hypothetical protein
MNTTPTGVTNAANLSLFMVNVPAVSRSTGVSMTLTIAFWT